MPKLRARTANRSLEQLLHLLDNPHSLKPGQELSILPVNGTYHEWQQGEGLNGVAKYYGVTPEDIINYAPNELDPATVGDFAAPTLPPGTG
ncbi:MAG: hypothetical protein IPM31_18000 [Anaerolineae bacterium]|nr:hypothetical protein [Anaerolineae bacterium]